VTGSDYAAARQFVFTRDGGRCVRCGRTGEQVHHRIPRGMGGSRSSAVVTGPANLVLTCARCHSWIESNRILSLESGWLVLRRGDPAQVPVRGHDGWWLLAADGSKRSVDMPGDPRDD
jgi:5-methylcytosine-specific restriction enzyme A